MWVSAYVGLPYQDGGRGPAAYDCWGLVRAVFAERLGVILPTYGDISAEQLRRVAMEIGARQDGYPWQPVDVPQECDVVVMRLTDRRWPGHVGIYAGSGHVLHTEKATGAVLAPLTSPLIRSRVIGYRRYAA